MQQAQVVEEIVQIPAVGSQFGGGFFAGEILLDGERYALIVAPKAAGEKFGLEFKKKSLGTADGTDSEDDGLTNSNKINDENHPAAQLCRSLEIGGHSDWYLPSRDELMRIWLALGPNKKSTPELFRAGGVEAFENRWYWSSTEHASYSYLAWGVNFNDGSQYRYYKDFHAGVRALRRFKI
jgi:hypothetical protein